jgi:hypothetical protein
MQARFLLALPLIIVAELLVHRRISLIARQFIDRDIITEAVLPKFKAVIASALKLWNSVTIELILFILICVDMPDSYQRRGCDYIIKTALPGTAL